MVISNVPIEFDCQFLVSFVGVTDNTQRFIIINTFRKTADLINLGLGKIRDRSRKTLTLRSTVKRCGFFGAFISCHEEQLVFENGSGENSTILFRLKIKIEINTFSAVTG